MFKSSSFDKTLESATSHLKLEPDWSSIMLICDLIRQNDVTPKYAIQQIKKKMTSQNPHSGLYALLVLESVVKNCGAPVHEEVFNKSNCEAFAQLVQTTTHENVRNKMLELIQSWSYAFRSAYKYRGIKDTMNILKTEGFKFPEIKDMSDKLFAADVAPEWADGDVCHRCRTTFSVINRKHHCRNCGQVFCGQCSGKTSILPKYGIEKEVRVCDGCYDQLQKPQTTTSIKKEEEDLPAEYLASSLSQQSQQPVRKSEDELREEEELQLALALSQSEAESKKQQSQSYRRTYPKSPSPEPPMRSPTPEPVETPSDPELARYLNRTYWEQRQATETMSPSAPSPMPSSVNLNVRKSSTDQDAEIDEFISTMRTQVEIFVNRMKSNSSRGRSIANDTSVQTLFMNITSMHSRLLTYLKEIDDKRLWYEQLQDKLSQVKDSRAALDVLRQEHVEKMRRIAEEQERQRQMQMAYKLEIMRKKKQEYLQYQRQLALQRIQEQEREMQMRQEQQKAQYMMGGGNATYPAYMSPQGPPGQGSPLHAPNPQQQYPGNLVGSQMNPQVAYNPQMQLGGFNNPQMMPPTQGVFPAQPHQQQMPQQNIASNPQSAFMPISPAQSTGMQIPQPNGHQHHHNGMQIPQQNGMHITQPNGSVMPQIPTTLPGLNSQHMPQQTGGVIPGQSAPMMVPPGSQVPPQSIHQPIQMMSMGLQMIPGQQPVATTPNSMYNIQNQMYHQMPQQIPQNQHQQMTAPVNMQIPQPQQQQQQQQQQMPQLQQTTIPPQQQVQQQQQQQQQPIPEKPKEVETAELISFD